MNGKVLGDKPLRRVGTPLGRLGEGISGSLDRHASRAYKALDFS